MKMPTLSLPTESNAVQESNKAAWNEARDLDSAHFFTTSYAGRNVADFVRALTGAGIATVIDIRHTPVSMYKPDFSKGNLARHLAAAGIGYLHMPEFGVPRDIRGRAAGQATRDAIWEWYDENVVVPNVGRNLHRLLNIADHPVALLCVELDPTSCHRHRLALALERKGLRGFDL